MGGLPTWGLVTSSTRVEGRAGRLAGRALLKEVATPGQRGPGADSATITKRAQATPIAARACDFPPRHRTGARDDRFRCFPVRVFRGADPNPHICRAP